MGLYRLTYIEAKMMEDENNKEYRWETGYEKTWEAIQEDKDGMLDYSVQDIINKARRKRLAERQGKSKLGMMRHLYLVLDLSENMNTPDLKPTRQYCVLKLLENFLDEYFYLNPISQVGIITTSNKRAEKVSDMSGNARRHLEVIKSLSSKACTGEPSLQNSLSLVLQSLRNMPPHASRELVILMGSLTTCDPGDINKTIEEAATMKVRCSVINLSAEVRVYKELAARTGGLHTVILDDLHLRDMLSQHLDPPAYATDLAANLVKMGFPSHAGRLRDEVGEGLGLCQCCLDKAEEEGSCKISTAGYLCPQCGAKYCELPVECRGCSLTLVSAPHLARSYHHLFPMPSYTERQVTPECSENCVGCGQLFSVLKERTCYECPKCRAVFCSNCDIFLHETLHSCPGCSSKPGASSQQPHTNGNGQTNHRNGV